MKTITQKQYKELEDMLKWLKKHHPRKYGRLDFHLNDIGDRIMLGMAETKGGAFWHVSSFMSYEAMWFTLKQLESPIDKSIKSNLETWKRCKII